MQLRRRRLVDDTAPAEVIAYQRLIRQMLLTQDGSTTLLCEAVAAAPVPMLLQHQALVTEVPEVVSRHLPGRTFIERIVTLHAHGEVMMDNFTYIALDGLPAELRAGLQAGVAPIGHLVDSLWTRRQVVLDPDTALLRQRLWAQVGEPDDEATRTHLMSSPTGPLMLLTECHRRGLLGPGLLA